MEKRQGRQLIPDRVTLLLTDQCNLECPHCFISNEEHPRNWEMGLPEYEKLFKSSMGQIGQLVVSGGEPILKENFVEIIQVAEKLGHVKSILLCTNGVLPDNLNKKMEDLLQTTSIVFRIQTSIDGSEEVHDKNRGGKGSYRKVFESLDLMNNLRKKYPGRIGALHVNTTLSKVNIEGLAKVIMDVKKFGFIQTFGFVRSPREHIFNLKDPSLISDYTPVSFDDFLKVEDMEIALDIINRNLWANNPESLIYAVNRVTLYSIKEMVKTGSPATSCRSGRSELIIMPNGEVAKCEMLKGFAKLQDFNWDLSKLLSSAICREFFEATSQCFCTHECSVALNIMYDSSLLGLLFSPEADLKIDQRHNDSKEQLPAELSY
ncbi:MAG: radical SAM protein [Nitrospina sp.]|nr:radical SAM protein [Nitrospina sp.]